MYKRLVTQFHPVASVCGARGALIESPHHILVVTRPLLVESPQPPRDRGSLVIV